MSARLLHVHSCAAKQLPHAHCGALEAQKDLVGLHQEQCRYAALPLTGPLRVCVYGFGGLPSAALGNLAANNHENQQAIAAVGGVAAVVGAMRGHTEDPDVQENGCHGA